MKSKMGFASPNFDHDKAQEARRRGGKQKVPKGFSMMSLEKRRAIAAKGGRNRKGKKRKKSLGKFDV